MAGVDVGEDLGEVWRPDEDAPVHTLCALGASVDEEDHDPGLAQVCFGASTQVFQSQLGQGLFFFFFFLFLFLFFFLFFLFFFTIVFIIIIFFCSSSASLCALAISNGDWKDEDLVGRDASWEGVFDVRRDLRVSPRARIPVAVDLTPARGDTTSVTFWWVTPCVSVSFCGCPC